MALTLAEAQRRSNNVLERGVYEVLINSGEVLPFLPFTEFNGTTYDYLRESTLPSVSWRSVNGAWTSSESVSTPVSTSLKILGGDIDLDRFLLKTLSNINDQSAIELQQKLKAMAREMNDTLVYGDYNDANTDRPEGIHEFLRVSTTSNQLVVAGASGNVAPTVGRLRTMLRRIKPGEPDVLLMPRVTRDGLTAYFENQLVQAMITMDSFGRKVPAFDGTPIYGSDYLSDVEVTATSAFSAKTGGDDGLIAGLKFGMDRIHGIQNGGVFVEYIGQLEGKNADRYRIGWYVNPFIVKSSLALAGIIGTDSDGTWAD